MKYKILLISTNLSGRDLSKVIKILLKSKLVVQVKRMQYIKDYTLWSNWEIIKKEQKLLYLKILEDKYEEFNSKFSKIIKNNYELLFEF